MLDKIYFSILTVLSLCLFVACNNSSDPKVDNANQEQNLKDAITQFPDSALLVEDLAQYYREHDNYLAAEAVLENKISSDSINARWREILAILKLESGDTLAALDNFRKAFALSPNSESLKNVATLLAYKKDEQAVTLAKNLMLLPGSTAKRDGLFIIGIYYQQKQNHPLAIKQFNKVIENNYTFIEAYIQKAKSLTDLSNYSEAIATLDKAIAVQNNNPDAYYYRGVNLEAIGNKEEAIKAYELVLLYSPGDEDATEALNSLKQKN